MDLLLGSLFCSLCVCIGFYSRFLFLEEIRLISQQPEDAENLLKFRLTQEWPPKDIKYRDGRILSMNYLSLSYLFVWAGNSNSTALPYCHITIDWPLIANPKTLNMIIGTFGGPIHDKTHSYTHTSHWNKCAWTRYIQNPKVESRFALNPQGLIDCHYDGFHHEPASIPQLQRVCPY